MFEVTEMNRIMKNFEKILGESLSEEQASDLCKSLPKEVVEKIFSNDLEGSLDKQLNEISYEKPTNSFVDYGQFKLPSDYLPVSPNSSANFRSTADLSLIDCDQDSMSSSSYLKSNKLVIKSFLTSKKYLLSKEKLSKKVCEAISTEISEKFNTQFGNIDVSGSCQGFKSKDKIINRKENSPDSLNEADTEYLLKWLNKLKNKHKYFEKNRRDHIQASTSQEDQLINEDFEICRRGQIHSSNIKEKCSKKYESNEIHASNNKEKQSTGKCSNKYKSNEIHISNNKEKQSTDRCSKKYSKKYKSNEIYASNNKEKQSTDKCSKKCETKEIHASYNKEKQSTDKCYKKCNSDEIHASISKENHSTDEEISVIYRGKNLKDQSIKIEKSIRLEIKLSSKTKSKIEQKPIHKFSQTSIENKLSKAMIIRVKNRSKLDIKPKPTIIQDDSVEKLTFENENFYSCENENKLIAEINSLLVAKDNLESHRRVLLNENYKIMDFLSLLNKNDSLSKELSDELNVLNRKLQNIRCNKPLNIRSNFNNADVTGVKIVRPEDSYVKAHLRIPSLLSIPTHPPPTTSSHEEHSRNSIKCSQQQQPSMNVNIASNSVNYMHQPPALNYNTYQSNYYQPCDMNSAAYQANSYEHMQSHYQQQISYNKPIFSPLASPFPPQSATPFPPPIATPFPPLVATPFPPPSAIPFPPPSATPFPPPYTFQGKNNNQAKFIKPSANSYVKLNDQKITKVNIDTKPLQLVVNKNHKDSKHVNKLQEDAKTGANIEIKKTSPFVLSSKNCKESELVNYVQENAKQSENILHFIDQGLHLCKLCNTDLDNVLQYALHLCSKEHISKIGKDHLSPSADDKLEIEDLRLLRENADSNKLLMNLQVSGLEIECSGKTYSLEAQLIPSDDDDAYENTLLKMEQIHGDRSHHPMKIEDEVSETICSTRNKKHIECNTENAVLEMLKNDSLVTFNNILDNVREISMNNKGALFIVDKLNVATSAEISKFLNAIINDLITLSTMIYGKNVIQKLYYVCTDIQRNEIVSTLSNCCCILAVNENGSSVLKSIIRLSNSEQKKIIFLNLIERLYFLSKNPNGYSVMEHVIEHGDMQDMHTIINKIKSQVYSLTINTYGIHVIKLLLEKGGELVSKIVDEMVESIAHYYISNASVVIEAFTVSSVKKISYRISVLAYIAPNLALRKDTINFLISCIRRVSSPVRIILINGICGFHVNKNPSISKVLALASHATGNRMIKYILNSINVSYGESLRLLQEIFNNVQRLSTNENAVGVILTIISKNNHHQISKIVKELQSSLMELCMDKFAGQVVQKCIQHAMLSDRHLLIDRIINFKDIAKLFTCDNGIKVIHAIIECGSNKQKIGLLNQLKPLQSKTKTFKGYLELCNSIDILTNETTGKITLKPEQTKNEESSEETSIKTEIACNTEPNWIKGCNPVETKQNESNIVNIEELSDNKEMLANMLIKVENSRINCPYKDADGVYKPFTENIKLENSDALVGPEIQVKKETEKMSTKLSVDQSLSDNFDSVKNCDIEENLRIPDIFENPSEIICISDESLSEIDSQSYSKNCNKRQKFQTPVMMENLSDIDSSSSDEDLVIIESNQSLSKKCCINKNKHLSDMIGNPSEIVSISDESLSKIDSQSYSKNYNEKQKFQTPVIMENLSDIDSSSSDEDLSIIECNQSLSKKGGMKKNKPLPDMIENVSDIDSSSEFDNSLSLSEITEVNSENCEIDTNLEFDTNLTLSENLKEDTKNCEIDMKSEFNKSLSLSETLAVCSKNFQTDIN